MAMELRSHGVCSVSLWPGAVKTEIVSERVLNKASAADEIAASESAPMLTAVSYCLLLYSHILIQRSCCNHVGSHAQNIRKCRVD